MSKEPIFGPNSKPMLAQTIVGLAAALIAAVTFAPHIGDFFYQFSCTYITGSCL